MAVEYKELRANPETERAQRNKIFDDIARKLASVGVEAGRDFITRSELEAALAGLGGGASGGQVDTIVAGDGIDVDATDPVNPEVSVALSTDGGNTAAFGTDGGLFVAASGGGGGIAVSQGSSDGQGPILATNSPAEISLPREVTFTTGWQIQCKPPGSITVDLRYDAFPTIPDAGDSITGSNQPVISSDTDNSGDLSTWTSTTLAAGGNLQVVITSNTGVRWFSLTVY